MSEDGHTDVCGHCYVLMNHSGTRRFRIGLTTTNMSWITSGKKVVTDVCH